MKVNCSEQTSKSYRISLNSEEGEEIGHVYLYLIKNDLHKEPYGFLEDVFIEEKYRSQGYGKKIMQEVIQKAKDTGCYKLLGTSRSSREKVHDFYINLGFVQWGKEFRMNFKE